MPLTGSGADELANTLMTSLTAGADFTVPEIDLDGDLYSQPSLSGELYGTVPKISMEDLTTGQVDGSGVFDKLMTSLVAHLKVEYNANRISGAEYTKAYTSAVGAALQTAQQFLLSKEQAYWSSLLAQQQARTAEITATNARILLETTRVELAKARYEALTAKVNYAVTKMQISAQDIAYKLQEAQVAQVTAQTAGITYTNANLLPAQKDQLIAQTAIEGARLLQVEAETEGVLFNNLNMLPAQLAQITYTTGSLMPAQLAQLTAQTAGVTLENAGLTYRNASLYPAELAAKTAQTSLTNAQKTGVDYQNANILPAQKTGIDRTNANLQSQGVGIDYTNANVLPKQVGLLVEQIEVQRAQTLNNRTDGATITGMVGKQKDLYTQQITSYQRDSELKGAKMWVDSWITQKTIDEGLLAPTQFTNTELNEVLTTIRTNLNLGS